MQRVAPLGSLGASLQLTETVLRWAWSMTARTYAEGGRTRFGRYSYANGGNAEAGRRAGINLSRIRFRTVGGA